MRDFSKDLPPILKGLAINNSEAIRTVYNKIARPRSIVAAHEPNGGNRDNEFYHFISFMPILGSLYELDGLEGGSINLGECGDNDKDWLRMVQTLIQERIDKYAPNEVMFNLMTVRKICEEEKVTTNAIVQEKTRRKKESSHTTGKLPFYVPY